ncbi:CHAD domain-containing protein [Methanospirillum lacunae]|nr:CHAD domain-containing protein [Methanospirillum lacunae]
MTGQRPIKCPLQNPDYCLYATSTFLPLLSQLEAELQGVVKDDDIEYVHRSRVATRRIRAAFPLFSDCLPEDARQKWENQIRKLTRSLGEARDLDVQIEFVRAFLAECCPEKRNTVLLFSSAEPLQISQVITDPALVSQQSLPVPPLTVKDRISSWIGKHLKNLHQEKEPLGGEKETASNIPQAGKISLFQSSDPVTLGLECLLLRLIQKRRVMQPGVSEEVSDFTRKGVIQDMAAFLHDLKIRAMLEGTGVHPVQTYERAFMQIMARVSDLFWFEPYLQDSSRIEQHHEMRIAAKRLRYTLEAYAGLYEDRLKPEIKVIKHLQELLGDIHDCDVWIGLMPRFLEEEEERSITYFGNHGFFELIKPGISLLITDREKSREEQFRELTKNWEEVKDEGFWNRFSEKISLPLQHSFDGAIDSEHTGPLTIALISDVHANLPALEAVLADAQVRGASVVLHAGDLTGYGPFPDEVINLIRERHIISVIGNYDLSVLSKKWKKGKPSSKEKQLAMRWAYHQISDENRTWLASLPRKVCMCVRGIPLILTHGSPDSLTEYLDYGTPDTRLHEIAAAEEAKVIITGHSHRGAAREVDGVWFINAGSVGRPEDGDPRACYALLTVEPFSIIHIRVPYEIERTIEELHHRHLPDAFARIIREGKSLDVVQDPEEQT